MSVRPGTRTSVRVEGSGLDRLTEVFVSGEGLTIARTADATDHAVLNIETASSAPTGFRVLRVRGPGGWSNPWLLRLDPWPMVSESEPNNALDTATVLPGGEVVAEGILRPRDVDHFAIEARAGEHRLIEVEARRLGTPILPVVTITRPDGRRDRWEFNTTGVQNDARFVHTFREKGRHVVGIHDQLYRGNPHARYRLRIGNERLATAIAPLGGPAGSNLLVRALRPDDGRPIETVVKMPESPGEAVPFPANEQVIPGWWLLAGSGREISTVEAKGQVVRDLPLHINGRIAEPNKVDRVELEATAGQAIHAHIDASVLGSWLDPVLTIENGAGQTIAENDDAPSLLSAPERFLLPSPDPRLVFRVPDDGRYRVVVRDRYGTGGLEYPYRVTLETQPADFRVVVRLPDGGRSDVFRLTPGSECLIPIEVLSVGLSAPVVVRAEGLPRGIMSRPVSIRTQAQAPDSPLKGFARGSGLLALRASPDARLTAGLTLMRVSGTANLGEEVRRTRRAEAAILRDTVTVGEPERPIYGRIGEFPVEVIVPGETR